MAIYTIRWRLFVLVPLGQRSGRSQPVSQAYLFENNNSSSERTVVVDIAIRSYNSSCFAAVAYICYFYYSAVYFYYHTSNSNMLLYIHFFRTKLFGGIGQVLCSCHSYFRAMSCIERGERNWHSS